MVHAGRFESAALPELPAPGGPGGLFIFLATETIVCGWCGPRNDASSPRAKVRPAAISMMSRPSKLLPSHAIRPRLAGLLGILLLGPAAAAASGETPWESSTFSTAVTSPYRNVRRRAAEKLRRRLEREGETDPRLPASDDPDVRRMLVQVQSALEQGLDVNAVTRRLVSDAVSRGREDLLDALITSGVDVSRQLRSVAEESQEPWVRVYYERYILGRIRGVFEDLIHDGSIPGFYDGQFSALWSLDPDMPERLIELAKDESYHFVIRVLAIMSLHETRRSALEEDLAPLLLHVDEEFSINRQEWFNPRRQSPDWLDLRRRADLSRYARFSLAKGGFNATILRMIARMEQELHTQRLHLASRSTDDAFAEHRREWLRGMIFESGYYYQQFDDYDNAVRKYLELVTKYPESRACQSAYYNLACIESIRGHKKISLQHLRNAVQRGFTDYEWLMEDGDLKSIRGEPEFAGIVELARTGQVQDLGRGWMVELTPELPVGKSLEELSPAEQLQVLQRVARRLSEPEIDQLLEALPADQRERVKQILQKARSSGPQGEPKREK